MQSAGKSAQQNPARLSSKPQSKTPEQHKILVKGLLTGLIIGHASVPMTAGYLLWASGTLQRWEKERKHTKIVWKESIHLVTLHYKSLIHNYSLVKYFYHLGRL